MEVPKRRRDHIRRGIWGCFVAAGGVALLWIAHEGHLRVVLVWASIYLAVGLWLIIASLRAIIRRDYE
jgi:hypothetical protein